MSTQKQIFTKWKNILGSQHESVPGLIQSLRLMLSDLENASGGGGGGSTVSVTQIQTTGNKIATITVDGAGTDIYAPSIADDVTYDNTSSGLSATNVQDAIDEVYNAIPGSAGSVSVTADGVKTYSQLLDELYALIDTTKINRKSILVVDDNTLVDNLVGTSLRFSNAYINNQNTVSVLTAVIKASASTYRTNAGGALTDKSAIVPTSGEVFSIIY